MDDSHSRIFGQPNVTGYKILALFEFFKASLAGMEEIHEKPLEKYNLTKYFFSYSVAEILKASDKGKSILNDPKILFDAKYLHSFMGITRNISLTVGIDLNAEMEELFESGDFDYKSSLKNANWCRDMSRRLLSSYLKDVRRKKASSVDDLLSFVT